MRNAELRLAIAVLWKRDDAEEVAREGGDAGVVDVQQLAALDPLEAESHERTHADRPLG